MSPFASYLGITTNLNFALIFASLLWVRILTIIAVIPFLFGTPVPRTVKTAASFVLMLFAFRVLYPKEVPIITEDRILLACLYMKEIFIGLCIGYSASLIFYGFQAAGNMIDNQRGMSIARILIPSIGMDSITSGFMFQLAVVVYLTLGGHLAFFDAVYRSYDILPLFEFPKGAAGLLPMMDLLIKLAGQVMVLAIQISAPIIIALLMADIILGVTNRVALQINVWELGFNVKGWTGILILFLSITMIISQMERWETRSNINVKHVISYFDKGMPDTTPVDENDLRLPLSKGHGKYIMEDDVPAPASNNVELEVGAGVK